jgi:amphi-Trp domain-containing protein
MTEDRDIDVSHNLASFVSELRRLADALEQSTEFTIQVDGEDVTVPEGAKFSVAHEREAGEVELEFQITWSVAPAADEDATTKNTNDADDADTDQAADKGSDDLEDATTKNTNDADDADTDQAADKGRADHKPDANGASATARPWYSSLFKGNA